MLIQGDAALIPFPDQTFHCAVFSPPYWGLRKYQGKQQRVWGGDADCEHMWNIGHPAGYRGSDTNPGPLQSVATQNREKLTSSFCEKCGAYYGALGLEPTPELYIQHIVEIFREVWRVLRDDGTVWLNMGDCYAGSGGLGPSSAINTRGGQLAHYGPRRVKSIAAGNLCFMPHRVAIALQAPYYKGRIKNETDRIWLAALIETEGCMFIHRRKAGSDVGGGRKRGKDTFGAGLEIANTNREIVERCLEIAGLGSVCEQSPSQNRRRDQTIYRWNLRTNQCKGVIAEVYPHMITKSKRHQARILINAPASGEKATKSWESVKLLHNGKEATIDFPAPRNADLWELGWIVRNDDVWSKSNPMPESVAGWRWERSKKVKEIRHRRGSQQNDQRGDKGVAVDTPYAEYEYGDDYVLRKGSWRHTRAHEFIFQLVKKMSYCANQEAVREGISESSLARINQATFHEQAGGPKDYGPDSNRSIRKTLENFAESRAGRNPRSVLDVPTAPYKGAHFATFPPKLIAPLIRASCPKRCCPECGAPWAPVVEKTSIIPKDYEGKWLDTDENSSGRRMLANVRARREAGEAHDNPFPSPSVLDYRPTCSCECDDHIPGICLDPFIGSGTTGAVARELGRRWVGLDISMEYLDQQAKIRALKWTPKDALDHLPLFEEICKSKDIDK